eukprot:CAMPEP_0194333516 /NCGR_PEP_ID=MMETSP0171-20130528/62966_1 /TAXON_ID=218684 /ORGANISM="Corethron pennatum, Strain L29A3" /LENGTH=78 /DNA_ID=CAMNT_0039095783 /DNA_START=31 /DNA_END=264 /DNA_ORIENTATION=-
MAAVKKGRCLQIMPSRSLPLVAARVAPVPTACDVDGRSRIIVPLSSKQHKGAMQACVWYQGAAACREVGRAGQVPGKW